MALTFDDIKTDEILTFVNHRTDGRTRTQHTHTARVTKITNKTVFLDDLTATTESLTGPRPVRYRLTRAGFHTRKAQRTTATGLPRRGKNTTSKVAQARLRPTPPTVHTLTTVTTQGGPTRVHAAGCPDIARDTAQWHSTPQTHQVVDRAGLIRPLVQDLLTEDPELDLGHYDHPDEFRFISCCPHLPWRATGAAFGHQTRHSDNPRVRQVVAALIAAGHTPATVVGDYDDPQPQATGFMAFPRGQDHVYIAHLHNGHDTDPTDQSFHHWALDTYARTLSGHDTITVLGRPMRVLRTHVHTHTASGNAA